MEQYFSAQQIDTLLSNKLKDLPYIQSPSHVNAVLRSINQTCKQTGGVYKQYSCKTVSWDDVSRHHGDTGTLLASGPNITDTYLKAKDGRRLFTLRPDNWNEKLGCVTTSDVAVVVEERNGGGDVVLTPRTLRDVLKNMSQYVSFKANNLSDDHLDRKVSIRFQTTFLPLISDNQAIEFAPESFNYNTHSDSNPKNLLLLCTTQGMAVYQDTKGPQRLFHRRRNPDTNAIDNFWLEAEASRHVVGGAQTECASEREDATKRNKSTACVLGTKAMGTRFNVLMTVQIPLQQKQTFERNYLCSKSMGKVTCCVTTNTNSMNLTKGSKDLHTPLIPQFKSRAAKGVSNAARVSRGSCSGSSVNDVTVQNPKRHPSEHITVTCVVYNTVYGGVPSTADVMAAIDDMEQLYKHTNAASLASSEFSFMKKKKPKVVHKNYERFPTDCDKKNSYCCLS